ncbi:MAG: DNA repair protein RecO [Planctomycetales bacterium]
MIAEKGEGIVIRQTDFSESSRVMTLFTREFGKISALAKGAKRLKGPFEAALDLLTRCNIVFLRKSSGALDLLTEAKLIQRFKAKDRSLESLYAGYYVAELLGNLTEEYDPHAVLYAETVQALDRFQSWDRLENAVARFELMLLKEIGHQPALEGCLVCERELDNSLPYAFKVHQGGVVCFECLREEPVRRIHAGTLIVMQKLLSEQDSSWERVVLSKEQIEELRSICNAAIAHVMGKRPKMLSYLKFS